MESAIDLKEPILQKPLLMKENKALIDQLHSKASDQKYTHLNGFRNLSSTVDPRRLQYRQINSGRLPCFSSYQASDARFSEINLNHQEIGNGDVTLQELVSFNQDLPGIKNYPHFVNFILSTEQLTCRVIYV